MSYLIQRRFQTTFAISTCKPVRYLTNTSPRFHSTQEMSSESSSVKYAHDFLNFVNDSPSRKDNI